MQANSEYDLEERLLEYAASVIRLAKGMEMSYAEKHVAHQLIRSGTSPLANHGEAQSAESDADFLHKMKLSLKELRESHRWLKLVKRVPLKCDQALLTLLLEETDELERIFNASTVTVKKRIAANKKQP